MENWLREIGFGFVNFFLSPLPYWAILVGYSVTYFRIKKERYNFGTKIFNRGKEWKGTWLFALLCGVFLSAMAIGAGIVISYPVILTLSAVTILLSLPLRFSWLSAAYTFGFTFLLTQALTPYISNYLPERVADSLLGLNWISFALLLSLFLFIEAVLLLLTKRQDTFPELVKGSRGKWVGQHRLRKLLVVPFFVLIPGGAIESFAPWWPFFVVIGGSSYGLFLLPLLTGFEHVVRGRIAYQEAKKLGRAVMLLAFVTLIISIASLYLYYLAIAAFAVALIGREAITFVFRSRDQRRQPFYTPHKDGMQILGIVPNSPADRLGLLVGERIEKVNGVKVATEREFYRALQTNSQYCKMEIRDTSGEIRFKQRAMYEGEPHELGIIFVKERYKSEKIIYG